MPGQSQSSDTPADLHLVSAASSARFHVLLNSFLNAVLLLSFSSFRDLLRTRLLSSRRLFFGRPPEMHGILLRFLRLLWRADMFTQGC